jgi:hypothetical protein
MRNVRTASDCMASAHRSTQPEISQYTLHTSTHLPGARTFLCHQHLGLLPLCARVGTDRPA